MSSESGFPDLRAFLDELRRQGELRVVDAEVDPRLEAAEIHRRVIASGGPSLLFTRVRGADLICVVQGGRIVERGSHEELLRAGGVYRELHERQFVEVAPGEQASSSHPNHF